MLKKLQFEDAVDDYLGSKESEVTISNISIFKDKPFYCWDTKFLEKRNCCFNHIIGLPEFESSRRPNPLFDYEEKLFNAWLNHKHIWVLKATGLGVTEFFLRLMMWLAVRNDDYKNAQFCIIVGPNIDLAKKLIMRMKNFVKDIMFKEIETDTQVSFQVNGVWIQAFPSNHLDSYRSLSRPKFIFVDEADFFRQSEQLDVRKVSERYVAKSRPWIVMVSTPNKPEGLMQTIELEEPSIYHKIKLGYEWGLDKIYDLDAIAIMKKSPGFEQEYNLKYEGKTGNVFSSEQIQKCQELGDSLVKLRANPMTGHAVGVDFGFNVSKSVICVGEWEPELKVLRLVKMVDFGSVPTTPSVVAERMWEIYQEYGPSTHFYVDGSNRGAVNEIKVKFGETLQWDKYYKKELHRSERIHPINFTTEHREMLKHMYMMVSNNSLAIPSSYDKLIVSMRTAQATDFDLDKDQTVNNDYLDACRLMCYVIRYERK